MSETCQTCLMSLLRCQRNQQSIEVLLSSQAKQADGGLSSL
jgi:hypothetical protein